MAEYLIRIEYWDKENHKRVMADSKVSADDVEIIQRDFQLDGLQYVFDETRKQLDSKIKEVYDDK